MRLHLFLVGKIQGTFWRQRIFLSVELATIDKGLQKKKNNRFRYRKPSDIKILRYIIKIFLSIRESVDSRRSGYEAAKLS